MVGFEVGRIGNMWGREGVCGVVEEMFGCWGCVGRLFYSVLGYPCLGFFWDGYMFERC